MFLYEMCDYAFNQFGCPPNTLDDFHKADILFCVLNGIGAFLYILYPIGRLVDSKIYQSKLNMDPYFITALLASIAKLSKCILEFNLAQMTAESLMNNPIEVVHHVRIIIILECIYILFGGTAAAIIVQHIVHSATGALLYDSFEGLSD